MTSRRPFATALLVALGLIVVGLGSRVATRLIAARSEWSRVKLTTIGPELANKLASLQDDVFLTYYVTSPERMPSHLRHVELEVVALLDALEEAAKGRLDWRLVDPSGDEDLMRFAARRKVAPVRVRSVAHDQWSEQEVWSTLSIAYGPSPPALVEGISREHLPRLQSIILEQLRQLESPRRPIFAVAAPREGHVRFRADLAARGELREVDLDHDQAIAADVDVLFLVAPTRVDASLLRRLRYFQESGGSIVVIGSLHRADLAADFSSLAIRPANDAFDAVIREFGIRAVPGLLLDRKSATQNLPNGDPGSVFRVGCLTLNQDFESLARDPRGTILFTAANPLQLDSERLADRGLVADVLATSSDESALLPVGGELKLDAAAALAAGDTVPKQPLLVLARPHERWRGTVVAASSATFVDDRYYGVETLANARTIETLIESLAKGDKLVMRRAGIVRPPPLPELTAGERALWRAIVVLLLPCALFGLLVWRATRLPSVVGRGGASRAGIALRVAFGVVAVAVLGAAARAIPLAVDVTSLGTNALAPHAARIADSIDHDVRATLYFSGDARLPPEFRSARRELVEWLRRYASAGADLQVVSVEPESLPTADRESLATRGIEPYRATSLLEEVTTVREFFATLVLEGDGRDVVLGFPDVESFENTEFRLALGLHRVATGDVARIGFASDIPRLSAGEAWQFYQQRGLIPPSGKDVYSVARAILEKNDFEIAHVNPRAPELPADLDALFWLQPRRSTVPMLEKFIEFVYRGGRALLAAQHFSMQARQYRGRDLDFVYWPQPQSPDVEEFYWPDLGVTMVREVLFDHNSFPMQLDTQLHRSGRREFDSQELAKSFCIRAAAQRFDRDSWITRTLADQPFAFGAFFRLDAQKLAASGLTAKPLMTTSEQAWSFAWKGGWIPPGMLSGPGATASGDDDVVPDAYLGAVPLAIDVAGRFPWPTSAFEFPPVTIGADGTPIDTPARGPYPHPEPKEAARPGRVVFLAQSEMFKDDYLLQLRPTFRPDHLLLNAAAELALGSEFASIMAHRDAKQGFEERVPAETVVRWRAIVVLGAALAAVALALMRTLVEAASARARARGFGGVA